MAIPSLLGVPPEVRLKVLRNCMLIGIVDVDNWTSTERRQASSQLLSVCKTIYNEGLPILYGENILWFWDFWSLEKMLLHGDDFKSEIKHVSLTAMTGITRNMHLLKTLPNLRSFHWLDPRGLNRPTIEKSIQDGIDNISKIEIPKTVFKRLSTKSKPVELGVVVFISSIESDSPVSSVYGLFHEGK
jgi:hypothetical protein